MSDALFGNSMDQIQSSAVFFVIAMYLFCNNYIITEMC